MNFKTPVKYNLHLEDFIYSNVSYDMYDDEYDDRYDDQPKLHLRDRGDDDADVYKYMEDRFEGYELVSDPSESSSDEDRPAPTAGSRSKNFCEDPALLRAQRERNLQQSQRHRPNVTDKSKGQGQSKDTQHNREKKNVNKSKWGNHNRKGGAQWKRNKGMLPS